MSGPWQDLHNAFLGRMYLWTRTPVSWDGFNHAAYAPDPQEPWVRPSPVEVLRQQPTMGKDGTIQIEGFYDVQCFFPQQTGFGEVDRTCDALSALFRNVEVATDNGTVFFMEPERILVGHDGAGWYQVNVQLNWLVLGHTPAGPIEEVWVSVETQSGHSFAAGNAVYIGSTAWALAQANSTATRAHGVVSAVNGSQFTVQSGGFVTLSNHGHTQGLALYLSTATAGLMTTTVPSAGVTQELGHAVDDNTVLLDLKVHST